MLCKMSSQSSSSRNPNNQYPDNTPPRHQPSQIIDDDDMRDAFSAGWETLISRHPVEDTKSTDKTFFRAGSPVQHRMTRDEWDRRNQQKKENRQRRKKGKEKRDKDHSKLTFKKKS